VLRGGVVAVVDVLGEAGHRVDAQRLQPVVFGRKIGVDLGVAGNAAAVLAEDVVGKQVLRVAARACAHRDQEEVGPFRDQACDGMGDDLDLHGEGPGFLQRLALVPDQLRCFQRLAHGLEAAGPGAFRRDQADVAADRQAVVGHRTDGAEGAGAVEGVGAVLVEGEGPAQEIVSAADLVEVVAGEDEGVGGDFAEAAVHHHRRRNRQKLDPRPRGGFGFLQSLDPQHGELMFATLVKQVLDGRGCHYATSTKTRSPSTFTGYVFRFTQTGARIASPVR